MVHDSKNLLHWRYLSKHPWSATFEPGVILNIICRNMITTITVKHLLSLYCGIC